MFIVVSLALVAGFEPVMCCGQLTLTSTRGLPHWVQALVGLDRAHFKVITADNVLNSFKCFLLYTLKKETFINIYPIIIIKQ